MEDKTSLLQQIFENVNTWLHFAEAKNAALIAFDIALLTIIVDSGLSKTCILLFSINIVSLLLSIIFALYSFKPINEMLEKCDNMSLDLNLLHFAYIASLEQEEYIKKLYYYYWNESDKNINDVPKLEKDYCYEIISNSRITLRKQKYFSYGFIMGTIAIIITGILFVLENFLEFFSKIVL